MKVCMPCLEGHPTEATKEQKYAKVDGADMKGCGREDDICGPDCEKMLYYFNCDICEESYKTYMCTF